MSGVLPVSAYCVASSAECEVGLATRHDFAISFFQHSTLDLHFVAYTDMPSRLLLAFGRPLAARANVPLSLWATGLGAKPSAAGWNFHPFGYGIRFKSEKKGSDPVG